MLDFVGQHDQRGVTLDHFLSPRELTYREKRRRNHLLLHGLRKNTDKSHVCPLSSADTIPAI